MGDPLEALYETLDSIQDAIRNKQLKELREKVRQDCVAHGLRSIADELDSVDWSDFKREVSGIIDKIVETNDPKIKALYYEYDPDNEWSGYVFACLDYNKPDYEKDFDNEDSEDWDDLDDSDDWACDWEDSYEVNVPEYPKLALDFSLEDMDALPPFLYAIVVLTDVMVEIVASRRTSIPICLGFHDQETITRL